MTNLEIKVEELKQLCHNSTKQGCNKKTLSKCDIKELGSGQFGMVKRCINSINSSKNYAVKMVKIDQKISTENKEKEQINLINEGILMINIGEHDNIIKIMGINVSPLDNDFEVSVLLEICNLGSFKSQLISLKDNNQQMDKKTVHNLVTNIATGMLYLVSKNIIHNDLSTRNVLLSSKTNNLNDSIAKISDFGLSRKLNEYESILGYTIDNTYIPRPIVWLSPEALSKNLFSEKSDVWSFGILLYEIEIFGSFPYYENKDGFEIRISKDNLDNFKKMLIIDGIRHKPNGVLEIYLEEIMTSCWESNIYDRVSFKEILDKLKNTNKSKKKKNNSKKKKK